MQRIGDLLPEAARHLGLEEELRRSRSAATWAAIVAERVPAAAGGCRLVRATPEEILVEADAPIVGQEIRLRSTELLEAFAATPAGLRAAALRVTIRPPG
jgi:hypothetical protein